MALIFYLFLSSAISAQYDTVNTFTIDNMLLKKPRKIGDTLMTSVIIDSIIIQYWLVDERRVDFKDFFESEEAEGRLLLFSKGSITLGSIKCDTLSYFDARTDETGDVFHCHQDGFYMDERIYYGEDGSIIKTER